MGLLKMELEFIWFRLGTGGGLVEHGNRPSGFLLAECRPTTSFMRGTLRHGIMWLACMYTAHSTERRHFHISSRFASILHSL
jgi:hypothetical protein